MTPITNPEAQTAEIRRVLEGYADAWVRGDTAALIGSYDDAFVLHYFGQNPLSGDHVGKMAALTALAEVSRLTHRKLLGIVAVTAGPTRGSIIARERFQRGDLTAELERVFVYAVRDGHLGECWVYDGDQRTVDRFLDGT